MIINCNCNTPLNVEHYLEQVLPGSQAASKPTNVHKLHMELPKSSDYETMATVFNSFQQFSPLTFGKKVNKCISPNVDQPQGK